MRFCPLKGPVQNKAFFGFLTFLKSEKKHNWPEFSRTGGKLFETFPRKILTFRDESYFIFNGLVRKFFDEQWLDQFLCRKLRQVIFCIEIRKISFRLKMTYSGHFFVPSDRDFTMICFFFFWTIGKKSNFKYLSKQKR